MSRALLLLLLLAAAFAAPAGAATRIKDIVDVQQVRDNQLIGYGLVAGLQGTGDTLRNSPYTEQALQSMLDHMGVNVKGMSLRARNVAAVIVTAQLPAYAGIGSRIDVNISSLGDATSLKGGTLMLTSLIGGDSQVYAVAQGPLAVSGITAGGQAETLTQGVPTAGRIPNGGTVERQLPGSLDDLPTLVLELKNPDFRTAAKIADAINGFTQRAFRLSLARAVDLRTVSIVRPPQVAAARFLAEIGDLQVTADVPARVVVDQRTGTVVIGKDVQISTVAVAHGNMTVRVTETPVVSQPNPFGDGRTVVVPRTQVQMDEQGGHLAVVGGASLETLVHGLNRIGLKPSDIIAILQAIKTAGALQAELVVQ